MDLGYFKLPFLWKIIQGEAIFISRYFMGTKLFDLEHNPIDLTWFTAKFGSLISQNVLIGAKTKLKVCWLPNNYLMMSLSNEFVD